MKTIGVVGAIKEEINLLINKMDTVSTRNMINTEFHAGKIAGKNVVLARSGMGKVNGAVCAQALIDAFGPDCIINTGIAGAVAPSINPGDVVISRDLIQHDYDNIYDQTGENAPPPGGSVKANPNLIELAERAFVPKGYQVLTGRIATGDQFIASRERKTILWDTYGAQCVEMEGGAIAQACFLNRVPFVVIRTVSDKADEEAIININEFVKMAADRSGSGVAKMLELM